MNNYEYIIASLPVLQSDFRGALDASEVLEEIRSQLSESDIKTLDFLLEGWNPDSLTEEFYAKAASWRNSFIKGYFLYDLQLRNCKVLWLNKALGRPEGQDILPCPEDDFEDAGKAAEVLSQSDILGRERGLDNLLWAKVDELTQMHVFDLDIILSFAAKLKIVDRWLRLDEAAGRELFEKLIRELKSHFIEE